MITRENANPDRPLIFISAAEPSADRHGAGLIRATRALCPDARFIGVAGPHMQAAGAEAVFDMSGDAAMLVGSIAAAGRGLRMLHRARRCLRRHNFAAAVLIDSPVLHLPLARRARRRGIPVLYYIAPQLWAWGASRIRKMRRNVERVAAILPFEEAYFRERGVNATYVGHPLAEQGSHAAPDDDTVNRLRNQGSPFVALLPGSRRHVVREVLPGQLDVARCIKDVFPDAAFGVSIAGERVAPIIERLMARQKHPVRPCRNRHEALIRAADLVLVASGTSTLEVAFHRRPMIVMYRASRFFYHLLGRWLIQTPYYSLPNILAGRDIVPEFMPYYTSTEPIARRAIELLQSETERKAMIDELDRVVAPLRTTRASENTARMLLELIGHTPA